MARVLLFPLYHTTAWWRHVASQLGFATHTTVLSDLTDGDICTTSLFYHALKRRGAEGDAVDAFGTDGCAEIIARCRFLRTIDPSLAVRLIGAMWRVMDEAADRVAPDLLIACVVDRYELDILERVLRRRGVRYAGLAVSPVPEQVMFMAKGEHTIVREPSEREVEAALDTLAAPGFVPAYVQNRFGLNRFGHLYTHWTLRWLAFEFLMQWKRNPLDRRYLSARYPACGYRVRLRDWQVMRAMDRDWRTTFEATPQRRRVFLGLQVTPEAAIDYWIKPLDLIEDESFFERAAETLTAGGYTVFVKDHPSQFGFRRIEHIRRLRSIAGVVVVPPEVPARALIDHCHATVTLTGTVGFQSAIAGRGAAVAVDTYYVSDGHFIEMRGMCDLDSLPSAIERWEPPADIRSAQRRIVRHVLRASVPGMLHWLNWSPALEATRPTAPLIESLNRYVPLFLPGGSLGCRASEIDAPPTAVSCL